MGLGLGTLPYQESKSPQGLCGAHRLGWEYLSLFQLEEWSFVFASSVCIYSTRPTPLLYVPSPGRGQVFLLHHSRGRQPAMHWPQEDTRRLQGTKPTPDADLALPSLLRVSKALFHSVLEHCVFLVTPVLRGSGQKCRLLFLVAGIVMVFTNLRGVGSPP